MSRFNSQNYISFNENAVAWDIEVAKLEGQLAKARQSHREALAFARTCQHPPTARNIFFSQKLTGCSEHFRLARELGYSFVAWNQFLYTADEIRIGELSEFGM